MLSDAPPPKRTPIYEGGRHMQGGASPARWASPRETSPTGGDLEKEAREGHQRWWRKAAGGSNATRGIP